MMEQPLISVIVPVYKVEPYLRQCVDSIINQTYKNLEIILVDDGSPDRCPEICDEYAAKDSRVRVIHKVNGGLSSARNAGLEIATGKYIGYVDSDDWIASDMYEKLLNSIIVHKSDISICAIQRYRSEIEQQSRLIKCNQEVIDGTALLRSYLVDNPGEGTGDFTVAVWNKLYHHSVWQELRFNESIKFGEDFPCLVAISASGIQASIYDEPLYYYRERAESITTSETYVSQGKIAFDQAFNVLNILAKTPQYIEMGLEYCLMRFFVYSNYLAITNLKDDFYDARNIVLDKRKQFLHLYSHYLPKYKVGLLLVLYMPSVFWRVNRIRMSGLRIN